MEQLQEVIAVGLTLTFPTVANQDKCFPLFIYLFLSQQQIVLSFFYGPSLYFGYFTTFSRHTFFIPTLLPAALFLK